MSDHGPSLDGSIFLESEETHGLLEEEKTDVHRRLALRISMFTFAPVLSVPAFLAIVLTAHYNAAETLAYVSLSLIFGFLLPMLVVLLFSRKKENSLDLREERAVPLLVVGLTYLSGSIILGMLYAPLSAVLLMFCYGTNTLVTSIISFRWKISIHAMGVGGPTSALLYAFGPVGGAMGLILPIVMWSRLYLRKHTPSQVIAGAALGYFLTAFQFFLLALTVFHTVLGVFPVVLASVTLIWPVALITVRRLSLLRVRLFLAFSVITTSLLCFELLLVHDTTLFILLSVEIALSCLITVFLPATSCDPSYPAVNQSA